MNSLKFDKMIDERYKLNLSELASHAKLGLIHYANTKSTDLIFESIDCGKQFCDIIIGAINLREEAERSESSFQKLFSEDSEDIDLDLYHFGKDLQDVMVSNGYALNKVLQDSINSKKILARIGGNADILSQDDIMQLYKYFEEYRLIVSYTLPDSWDNNVKSREKYYRSSH